MSETRPRLEVVSAGSPAPEGAPERSPGAPRRDDRNLRILGGLLVAALLLCAGGWLAASQEAGRLSQRLGATEAALAETRTELSRAEGRLAAFEGHLGAARERVGALAREIGALGAFLAEGPGGSTPEPAAE